jgi:protein involved in polysaccharide export with SLBB domain
MDRAYTLNAELTRFAVVDGKYREQSVTTVNLEQVFDHQAEDVTLQAYDKVIVRRIPNWQDEGSIQIIGEVRFPGEYPVIRGEKLSNVLERAGGLTDEGYPEGAVFLRESIRQREQQELDRLSLQLQQDIALIKNDKNNQQAVRQSEILLGQMRSAEAVGRMVIDLDAILEHKEDFDVTLQDGDRLYIPPKPEVVTVIGEVHYPTSHIYNGRNKLKKYIQLSGGLTDNANKKAIYVIHVDGSVTPAPRWFSGGLDLGPGDTVVIPPKVERITKLQLYTDISQVLYQLAVTAASLKVLNIF